MDRRELLKITAGAAASVAAGIAPSLAAESAASENSPAAGAIIGNPVEQWTIFELRLVGPSTGNPYTEVDFHARFTLGSRVVVVPGFYDGDGNYRVRFSPDSQGVWTYETWSRNGVLSRATGSFPCIPPRSGNHGPVGVAHQFHFQHADGTPYFPFGTTCYSYGFIEEPIAQSTLADLKNAGFNKVRLCLLPKPLGTRRPAAMPFEQIGTTLPAGSENLADGSKSHEHFDTARINPAYFRMVEQRIAALDAAGIQADLILFHPYDAWGFKAMGAEADDRYLRYAVARLSAYRNVWWSIANEYDLVKSKTTTDWDRFFRIVAESDPHGRLRSIHQSKVPYDNTRPWVTHASLQQYDFEKTAERFDAWNKPVIYDEIQYEGNIARRWGNLSAEEMTHRFWRAIINGAYATHGETFLSTDNLPVWSDAGKLHGTSAPRLAFLRKILEESGTTGLFAPPDPYYPNASNPNERYLWYFDFHSVGEYEFPLPEKINFKATLIDPWQMTRTPLTGAFTGKSKITLPGKPYMAVLFERA